MSWIKNLDHIKNGPVVFFGNEFFDAIPIKQFKKVIQADSLSELSVSAAYFLGYQYDYKYAELDSAAKYYAWISSMHPNSEQNNIAKMRVQVIQNMLLTLKNDSTVTTN